MKTIVLAAAAVAGLTGLAFAAAPVFHEMTVAMPDGGVAHIRYTGDVAPKVNFVRTADAGLADTGFVPSPFVEMQRISALMDAQMADMMARAHFPQQAAMQQMPLSQAQLQPLPAASYSFVSTMSGNGLCMKSVQITATGNGAPKVVSQTSGNCGEAAAKAAAPVNAKPAEPASTSGLQTISYHPGPAHPRPGI